MARVREIIDSTSDAFFLADLDAVPAQHQVTRGRRKGRRRGGRDREEQEWGTQRHEFPDKRSAIRINYWREPRRFVATTCPRLPTNSIDC